ncbi:hypothetical protein b3_0033 [Synechococcus phage B3]|jgi:hypothetical protein|nr:hypothetical protein b3_0033 [Synechococcus phage B3]QGT54661.1 hypothetical protein b23_0033 [Synechococcus phage B23]
MSREEALVIIRSGKNGTQILDLLDKVATLCPTESTVDSEFSDVKFND